MARSIRYQILVSTNARPLKLRPQPCHFKQGVALLLSVDRVTVAPASWKGSAGLHQVSLGLLAGLVIGTGLPCGSLDV